MRAAELLRKLGALGVKIWSAEGVLHCNGPKEALTAELRAALSECRAEILESLEQSVDSARLRQPPLERTLRDGDAPPSFAQERLWFLDQFEPNTSLYNVPRAVRICGPLNLMALERAFNEIIRRHEVLRTTFLAPDGRPVQKIAPPLAIRLPLVDLAAHSAEAREAQALELASAEIQRPFNLSAGPLIRAILLRLAGEDHVLVLTLHHIVSDGWSIEVLNRELSKLYSAYSMGQASPLPELPVQYADFAQWQREWLKGEIFDRQVGYWRDQLQNVAVLHLPADRPRSASQRHLGAREAIVLSSKLLAGLQFLSQRERVTLFMTLLAAFKTLLHRYTSQEDIAVATPIAGRNRIEIEALIGFFVNTLVLRSRVAGHMTFRELLRVVRDVALAAYSNQDLPFEKMVEELNPERNLAHAPLAQVMFALQSFAGVPLEFSGCSIEPLEFDRGTAKFDLTLQVSQHSSGMRSLIAYRTDLFDKPTIVRMLERWRMLLESIVVNPDQPISDLPILTSAERDQLFRWNDTRREYPGSKCLHQLIQEQAERTPEAAAIICPASNPNGHEDAIVTYQQLNSRANQLAHYLTKRGVGPEVRVGIFMERSADMVTALLGVLKADGAYVPLDPEYPVERLGFVLRDCAISVMLTESKFLGPVRDIKFQSRRTMCECDDLSDAQGMSSIVPHLDIICLDNDWPEISRESTSRAHFAVAAENLAYVIYTSGTTGHPKGVMIQHRSLVNYLHWVVEDLFGDRIEMLPVVSKLTFDASVKQIWAPLLRGQPIWLLSNEQVDDPGALFEAVITQKKSAVNCVPSLWQIMLSSKTDSPDTVLPCRNESVVLLGGDRLNQELVARSFELFPNLRLWNIYGPTEATANAVAAEIRRGEQIAIGRPIHNTQLYLLDRSLNLVPVGVPGELYIGGDSLARGYVNKPELTAEKFLPDPFSKTPGSRLYKTGDRARYLANGNLEFLDRVDDQVKIRGFRIELGEIESTLRTSPSVREALVLANEESHGDTRLVAYVIADLSVDRNALRNFLLERLPNYMVPSVFIVLESWPLTSTGKIDRKALPSPDQYRPAVAAPFLPPRTATEEVLAKIWADVLKLDRIGIHENFFELGGHSLLATQVVSRLRQSFHLALPVRILFEYPSVAALAERVDTSAWIANGADEGISEENNIDV